MNEVLQVKDLHTFYYSKKSIVPACDGVDFTLKKGEILGIVGESGCGKSTVVRSVVGLIDKSYTRIEKGEVLLGGEDLLKKTPKEMCKVRGKRISMIFQNPLSALNPVYTVGNQICEILMVHENMTKKQARERAIELLKVVKIPSPEMRMNAYPHELSGGMQQRVMIAIALACNPEVIIADEPTTALDVTIQAQILDLLREVRDKFGVAIILITHNMGVVADICEKMLVMYGGVVVEQGTCKEVFANPQHPYTQGLLASIPSVAVDKDELYSIEGTVPTFSHPVTQCRFSSRCQHACDRCRTEEPLLYEIGEERKVRCFLHENNKKEAL